MFEDMRLSHAVLKFEDSCGNIFEVELRDEAESEKLKEGQVSPAERTFTFYALRGSERDIGQFGVQTEVDEEGNSIETFAGYRLTLTDKAGEHRFPCIFPREVFEDVNDFRKTLDEFMAGGEFTFRCRYTVVTVNGEKICWIRGWAD